MANKISISDLSERMKQTGIVLVDVLDEEIYDNVHIKDAINIPFHRLEHDAFVMLDPRDVIVTYSIDFECPVSRLAAERLLEFGFRKVYYYSGGLKEWIEADMPVVRSNHSAMA